MYGAMMQAGASFLSILTAPTPYNHAQIGKDAYNNQYQAELTRYEASEAMVNAEANIAAAEGDLILTNLMVQKRQAEAEAMIQVSAAAAGVQGGSVEDALYQTEVNEATKYADNIRTRDQRVTTLQAEEKRARQTFLSVKDPEIDIGSRGPSFANRLFSGVSKVDLTGMFGSSPSLGSASPPGPRGLGIGGFSGFGGFT